MNEITTKLEGLEPLLKDLNRFVPKNKRRWVWQAVAREAIKRNRKRVRDQKNLDGSDFQARADGSKRRMLTRILGAKQLRIAIDEHGTIIHHKNPVGAKQHFGDSEVVRAKPHEELNKIFKKKNKLYRTAIRLGVKPMPVSGDPCSKKQAKTLKRELGFKKSLKWLQSHFTVEQAGYMIKKDRIARGIHPKRSWAVVIPARDVLGFMQDDIKPLMELLEQQIEKHTY